MGIEDSQPQEGLTESFKAANEIQEQLIREYAGEDVGRQLEWVKLNSERFREIVDSDSSLLEIWQEGEKDQVLEKLRRFLDDSDRKAA